MSSRCLSPGSMVPLASALADSWIPGTSPGMTAKRIVAAKRDHHLLDLSFLIVQALNGLASASSLFIIAAGLTIVFGVTRIVNFAHGSFYMLGAYFGVTLIPRLLDVSSSFPMFLAGVLAAARGVGLIGLAMELVLLRRIYKVPELFQLLATFGVVLAVQELVLKIWGPLDILGPRAPGLRGAVDILGHRFPSYELFLIAMGPLVLGALWLLMHKTRFGVLVRAATQDREMVGALGVNQALLFTGALFLGAALAGLGGALQTPKLAANPHMDISVIADAYAIKVAIEVLAFALAAFSLNFLIGVGGIVSFGHAAYFGLGAYAAGLMVTRLGLPMEPALVAAPLIAGLGAALFGFFVVRLTGIYLAMLTLAFAQIVYAVAFQWVEVTGGDNGVVGVWPSRWAAGRTTYYYLVLVVSAAAVVLLRRGIYAPFGYTLRAARDSAVRADAIGIDVRTHRWLAFTIAGAAAGLAGGLFAFSKGSIDPTLISIPMSVDFLVMTLLGGVQTVVGPLVGAAAFHSIRDLLMPLTDYWRLLLGLAIIAIVLAFPRGIVGGALLLRSRLGWG